ncbi:MAG: YhcH/YjgK/YiaL family protein, partial [Halobacteriovoraceae bacterium]|nr:YhcH/YjgK/YiaL family protein [Halobacteriovoraceae bacterium]
IMIHDRFENIHLYNLGPVFQEAFDFIKGCNEETEEKKYSLSGEMFASIESYPTKTHDRAAFESHRKFIDIQFTIKGSEKIGYASIHELKVNKAYNEKADIIFYEKPEIFSSEVTNFEGYFTILFPEDAHMPGLQSKGHDRVKKGVVKVPVNR